jgi:hypothetical protein
MRGTERGWGGGWVGGWVDGWMRGWMRVCMHTEVRVYTQTQHMRHDTTKDEEPFDVV